MRIKILFLFLTIFSCSLLAYGKNDSCLIKFKQLAEEYNPISQISDTGITPDVPIFDKTQRRMILKAYKKNPKEAENYVMLILLKVYRAQLKCCKMGYNLSDNGFSKDYNTIVYLFIKATNFCKIKSKMDCTYISSATVYNLINNHHNFLNYSQIKREYEEIEILVEAIFKG